MMDCTLDEPYISIYDKPKRPRGRPKTLTDEQKKERDKIMYKRHDNNRDYYVLKAKIYYELNKEKDNARRRARYHEQKNKNYLKQYFFDFL